MLGPKETSMADKSAFLTEGWVAALQAESQKLLDARPDGEAASFSYVERFSDAPDPGSTDRRPGYRMDIAGGRVTIRGSVREAESADCVLVMDYAAAFSTLTVKSGPEMDALSKAAFDKGLIRISGSFDGMPIDLAALHDAMVDRTAVETAA
jgi:hypothetical protein